MQLAARTSGDGAFIKGPPSSNGDLQVCRDPVYQLLLLSKTLLNLFFFNPCAHFQGLTKNSKIRTMISLFTQRLPCASEPSKSSSKLFQKMFSVITIKKNILLKACLFVPMSVLSPHTSSSGPSHSLCYFSLSHD